VSPCAIDQPKERKRAIFKAPFDSLIEQKASGFQRMVTGDESWFFFDYSCDSVEAASRDNLPERIKRKGDT
jgi:hypothetical protein